MSASSHRRTANAYASTAALVRHHAETLLGSLQEPPKPPEPSPDPSGLTRCPCHGQWAMGGVCAIPDRSEPTQAEPEPTVIVVRAVVDAPDRGHIDYLDTDQKWTCDQHPRATNCPHLDALRDHLAGAALKTRKTPA